MTAEATAKQTTLEGNAEAGIVLSKGEAEAKALALRAEAYRQFNEAAIIQTVLSMLPDIVRAAAEPMSHIDSLTVLSNEGASDMVKNVTRTVTEASTTVKGLTGIDIPDLLNKALGNTPDEPPSCGQKATKPSTPPKGGGPSGSGSSGGTSAGGGTTPPSGRCQRIRADRERFGVARRRLDARRQRAAASATEAPPPRFETPEAVDAAIADADAALRRAAAATTAPLMDSASGPARPASAAIDRETTVHDAAVRLATDLQAIPGIERFSSVKLAQLERAGPRPLRNLWRFAKQELGDRYGEVTIGEVLERYGNGQPPS